MNQISQEKNSLKLVWNGKPEKITLTPSVLEIKEFISYKSSNLNQLKKINPDYWSNLLIKGNNLNTISSLLEAPFKKMIQKSGGIKLAYIDPPFFTGQDRFLNKSISKNPNINSNEKIRSVIFTNIGECVIGVTIEQQCIMINFSYEELKGDGGIRMVQDSAREMGDLIIDDLNEVFRTDAKFHSTFRFVFQNPSHHDKFARVLFSFL